MATTTMTTTTTLARQRCWVHLEREAAARCPVCTHFYCRECVTEHEGRVICAPCLRNLLAAQTAVRRTGGIAVGARRIFAVGARASQLILSVALAWFFFHLLGQWVMSGGAEFHEASVWKDRLLGDGSGSDPSSDDDDHATPPATTPAPPAASPRATPAPPSTRQ